MINQYMDHTLLKANATTKEIQSLCEEAHEHGFYSVCLNPCHVKYAKKLLAQMNSSVKVATVIGFPLGANTPSVKAFEAAEAIQDGADELDMVLNIGALKEGNETLVLEDIQGVVKEAHGNWVKVIIETCYLTDKEKILACQLAERAGAKFVKTSTGFGTSGATLEDVSLMESVISERMCVKASGGIRDYKTAEAMLAHGAKRLGTSASVSILKEEKAHL